MNLSGLVAVLSNGEVVEVRDLGPKAVACKPGAALPLVDDYPDLGPRQQYGEPTFEVRQAEVIRHWKAVDLPALTHIPKDFIWRRTTDQEAVIMRALLASQPVRLQEIYAGANYVSTADEFYPTLLAGLTAAFGEARALELLEPTE